MAVPRMARRFGTWFGGALFLALASWGAVTVAQHVLSAVDPPPPPVPAQLTSVIRGAARSGLFVAQTSRADLHGNGGYSTILVLRPRDEYGNLKDSDQLRIYDLQEGRLRETFRYQPLGTGALARFPFAIDLRDVADLEGNGTKEVVADVTAVFGDGVEPFPALVYWDPLQNSYRLRPLLPAAAGQPDLGSHVDSYERRDYETTSTIRDTWSGSRFRAYPVWDYFVRRTSFSTDLIAAFRVRSRFNADPNAVYELNAWNLLLGLTRPSVNLCVGGSGPSGTRLLFRVHQRETFRDALARVWRKHPALTGGC